MLGVGLLILLIVQVITIIAWSKSKAGFLDGWLLLFLVLQISNALDMVRR